MAQGTFFSSKCGSLSRGRTHGFGEAILRPNSGVCSPFPDFIFGIFGNIIFGLYMRISFSLFHEYGLQPRQWRGQEVAVPTSRSSQHSHSTQPTLALLSSLPQCDDKMNPTPVAVSNTSTCPSISGVARGGGTPGSCPPPRICFRHAHSEK